MPIITKGGWRFPTKCTRFRMWLVIRKRGLTAASPFPRGIRRQKSYKRIKKVKVMKQQAIQLQFDFTDNVQPALTDRLELAVAAKAMLPAAMLFAYGVLFVAFVFAIIFISAIIQG